MHLLLQTAQRLIQTDEDWEADSCVRAFVTAKQLSVAGEESQCCMCYLTVLNVQKVTENIDARTHTL